MTTHRRPRTTPLPGYGRTAKESWKRGYKLHLESVDCQVCGRPLVPCLLTLPNGDTIGLCAAHLGEYSRLYLESTQR